MNLNLKDKVVLVLASSKGIGKAIADELTREGARSVTIARHDADVLADLTKEEDISRIVQETLKKYGRIDIFIFNTGTPQYGNSMELNLEDFDEGYIQILRAFISFTKKILPIMKKQKFGRIIALTAAGTKEPIVDLVISNVFRGGVTSVSKTLSELVGKDNITVNNIALGYFKTTALVNLLKTKAEHEGRTYNDVIEEIESKISIGRIPQPEEVAYLVTFLSSDKASAITGTTISIDGGMMKGLF